MTEGRRSVRSDDYSKYMNIENNHQKEYSDHRISNFESFIAR
jgi:hypothetical protein